MRKRISNLSEEEDISDSFNESQSCLYNSIHLTKRCWLPLEICPDFRVSTILDVEKQSFHSKMLFGSRKGRLEVGNRKERLALPIDRERGGKDQRRIKDLQVKQVFQWWVEHASIRS